MTLSNICGGALLIFDMVLNTSVSRQLYDFKKKKEDIYDCSISCSLTLNKKIVGMIKTFLPLQ